MANNTGMSDKEYETLTKEIHQALLRAEGHDTIQIEHDKKIKGKSLQKHQIDVYWKFSVAGVTHQTAIECKYYKKTVSLGHVRSFFAALEDIGNINGAMVTTKGYQTGAVKYAESKGIKLLIIRSPTDLDLTGLLRRIEIKFIAISKVIVSCNIQLNNEWISNNKYKLTKLNFQLEGMSKDFGLSDSAGLLVLSWSQVENSLPIVDIDGNDLPADVILEYPMEVKERFVFIPEAGLAPIKSITITYKIHRLEHQSQIESPVAGLYVVRHNETGEKQFYDSATGKIGPNLRREDF